MPTRSDKPTSRKATTRSKTQETIAVDPATQRAPNAQEAAPETLVPDVVRTNLTRENVLSDLDRGQWVAARAYQLAEARGFAPGAELDDWLQAERDFDAMLRSQARPEDQFTG